MGIAPLARPVGIAGWRRRSDAEPKGNRRSLSPGAPWAVEAQPGAPVGLVPARCILTTVRHRRPSEIPCHPVRSSFSSSTPRPARSSAASLTGVGYAVETVTDADEAVRRAGEYSLVIIDVIDPARSPADVCREIRETPEPRPDPGPVHLPDRRRRGADPVPRGRRRRCRREALRRARARGPGRGAAAPLPAVTGLAPMPALDGGHGPPGPADRRGLQPEGRRAERRPSRSTWRSPTPRGDPAAS